ncbi:MAG TPA: hypothetical protein VF137_05735 [Candidatus Dormibacteraeota bacterium]
MHSSGTGIYADSNHSNEPPDQGLCVGNGYIVEPVNDAIAVYTTAGVLAAGPIPMTEFFGLTPEHPSNAAGPPFGPFLSDPRCYFDPADQRWFLTELELGVDSQNDSFDGTSANLVAVSAGSTPTSLSGWTLWSFDTTDAGANGCPCFGDQPHIGADKNGLYVSNTEFGIPGWGSAFVGAIIYAFSKPALESGSGGTITGERIDATAATNYASIATGGPAATVQPASSPGAAYAPDTEYFLSGLDDVGTTTTGIGLWTLSGTSSLGTTNAATLSLRKVDSEPYTQAPNMVQKKGPLYLGSLYNDPEGLLTGDADVMQQVVYAAGNLWSGLNTAVQEANGPVITGIAWFEVSPSGSMVHQGYLAAPGQNAVYPSVGVTAAGRAVIGFSLAGPDLFPSTGYAYLDPATGPGPIHIAGNGVAPNDGITCYPKVALAKGDVCRWGDYSAAVADTSGNVWMAAEWVPALYPPYRSTYENWGTFITEVTPS